MTESSVAPSSVRPGPIDMGGTSATAEVLIVDDHQELAENMEEILALAAFPVRCTVAARGADAMRLAAAGSFELALVDLHLPDGSGLALLSSLREVDPFVEVVVITGDSAVEGAIGALEQGAFGYVLKPFQPQQLLDVASKALERSRLLRQADILRRDLERSERRNRQVLERVPAFVLALDEADRIAVWNRELERVTGYSAAEKLGSDGRDLLQEQEISVLDTKTDGVRSVRWRQSVVAQRSGHAPLTYAIGVDVTDEVEMQRRARRAERLAAVGTLAAGLAHEVRNPLNSANLQLELLQRRIDRGRTEPASLDSIVQIVRTEIERLDHLVNDFLDFAKPAPLDARPTDLAALLSEVAQLLRVEAEERGVELILELEAGTPAAQADPLRIRQVLLNLVRNGLEATAGSGQVRLRLGTGRTPDLVRVEVEDTGPGFVEDAPIFDAFFTTKDQGTGLGLAIVHRIITEHDGTIEVASEPGCTRFEFSLPRATSGGDTDESAAQILRSS